MLCFSYYLKCTNCRCRMVPFFKQRCIFIRQINANICTFCLFFFLLLLLSDVWLKGPSRAAIWSMIACIYPCNWNNERWLLWAISHKFLIFLFNPGISCQCAGRSFGEETLRISFASPQTVIFFPLFFSCSFSLTLTVCLFELMFLILRSSPRCMGVLVMFWWEQSKTEPKYSWYS